MIEAGADSLLAQKPAALELCEELGLARSFRGFGRRGAFVLRSGRLYPLPRPSLLGIPPTWRGLAGYHCCRLPRACGWRIEPLVPAQHGAEDESVGVVLPASFRRSSVDLIAQPLLGGIHAGDIEQLSMQSLFPRLLDAERTDGSVLRAVRSDRPPKGSTRSATPFVALRHGMGSLVEALERALPPGTISWAAVDAHQAGHARLARVERPETFDARAIIFAAPASAAATLLAPIDASAARSARRCPTSPPPASRSPGRGTAIAHPLSGHRLRRRAAPQRRADHRVHVGLVQVGRPRAGGHGAPARLHRRRARSGAVDLTTTS